VIHVRYLRLYAVAILFAVWAAVWALGLHGDGLSVAFLLTTAVCVVVSERERQRLVRDRKDGYE
jgi:hypothetical protein